MGSRGGQRDRVIDERRRAVRPTLTDVQEDILREVGVARDKVCRNAAITDISAISRNRWHTREAIAQTTRGGEADHLDDTGSKVTHKNIADHVGVACNEVGRVTCKGEEHTVG